MKKILLLLLICSCSKEYYFQRDQEKLSMELKQIYYTDQGVRQNEIGNDSRYRLRTFYTIIDSLRFSGKKHPFNFDFSKLPKIDDQLSKLSPELAKDYKNDAIKAKYLRNYIDRDNFEKLYKIIKKYGYPSYDNRKWKTEQLRTGITTVLFHINPYSETGKKYFDIMLKEYRAGRVDETEMRNYIWAFHGRLGTIDFTTNIEELIAKAVLERKTRRFYADEK